MIDRESEYLKRLNKDVPPLYRPPEKSYTSMKPPRGSWTPPKPSSGSKVVNVIVVGVIIVLVVFTIVAISEDRQIDAQRATYAAAAEQARVVEEQRLASMTPEQIRDEIAAKEFARQEEELKLEKQAKEARTAAVLNGVQGYEGFLTGDEEYFKSTKASDADLEKIRKTLVLFSALAEQLDSARQGKDALSSEDIAYLKGIETRLSGLQQKTLPGLRLAFRKKSAELLWEHDTYVTVSGEGNRIINLTAGMFAANANIQSTQTEISEILYKLRFKEARYRWYKEADEYTVYKLDTPPDAKLAPFKFGEFQDMASGY